jgi:hypothetical protein
LREFSQATPPNSLELAGDNVTAMSNRTTGELLDGYELASSTPAPGEIQMDKNGDGIVDETESQNTVRPKAGVQGPCGSVTQTESCEAT